MKCIFLFFISIGFFACKNPKQESFNELANNTSDTFIYESRTFRLQKNDDGEHLIQYLEKDKWVDNVSLSWIGNPISREDDINNDGFKDLSSLYKHEVHVSFYMPDVKLFSKRYIFLTDNFITLDTLNQVYISYAEPYHICNNYVSELFIYKKGLPDTKYYLEGETDCEIGNIKLMKLYKYNEEKDTSILIDSFKPKDSSVFDYERYWKKQYKKLLGIK